MLRQSRPSQRSHPIVAMLCDEKYVCKHALSGTGTPSL